MNSAGQTPGVGRGSGRRCDGCSPHSVYTEQYTMFTYLSSLITMTTARIIAKTATAMSKNRK